MELKTVERLCKANYAQVRSYLRATRLPLALLANSALEKADVRRGEANPIPHLRILSLSFSPLLWSKPDPFLARSQRKIGRPTIPMEQYLRLMVLKHRYNLGYEPLVSEVADSIKWRRFCRIGLAQPVPHSTMHKLLRL